MSVILSKDDILFSQRFLKVSGFYTGKLDGIWGKKTDAGIEAFTVRTAEILRDFEKLDSRSEVQIASLQPPTQIAARTFIEQLAGMGIEARIISGTRTYAEQEQLYKKGRFGSKEQKVTNARGGESNHNFGIAWDIGIFKQGKYLPESSLYDKAGKVQVTGVEWGGNWKSFQDRPHYQLKTGMTTTQVRQLFESGKKYWV